MLKRNRLFNTERFRCVFTERLKSKQKHNIFLFCRRYSALTNEMHLFWLNVCWILLFDSVLFERERFFWRNVSQINSIERTNFMAINYRYKRNWFSLWTWFFLVEYMRWFPVLLSNLHLFQFKGMKLCSNAYQLVNDRALVVSVPLNKTKIKNVLDFPLTYAHTHPFR